MTFDSYSCIKKVREKVHIPLPMSCVRNPALAVKEYLEKWKCRYITLLEGLVVDFDKVTFESPLGRIIDDQPYVHYDVKADFSIFMPSVGDILKGIVNRISREHIGCVVHNSINATIHMSEDTPGDVMSHFGLDSPILFEVTNIDIHRKVIQVEGKLTNKCIELTRNLFPEQFTKHMFFDGYDSARASGDLPEELSEEFDRVSKRKSKKRKRESADSSSSSLPDHTTEMHSLSNLESSPMFNSTPVFSKPKKKKRKHNEELVDYTNDAVTFIPDGQEFNYSEPSTSTQSTFLDSSTDTSRHYSGSDFTADGNVKKKKKKKKIKKEEVDTFDEAPYKNSKSHKKHKKHSKKE